MKNQIYFFILGFMAIISITILFLYFTQDFEESISIEDEIPFWNIQLETQNIKNIEYLNQATLDIGELELENTGIFTQKYEFPKIVGCINIIKPGEQKSFFEEKIYFDFYEDGLLPTSNSKYPNYYNLEQTKEVEIVVNEKKSFNIIGTFNPGRIAIEEFYEPEITSITIFTLDPKTTRISSTSTEKITTRTNCEELFSTLEPYKTIILS